MTSTRSTFQLRPERSDRWVIFLALAIFSLAVVLRLLAGPRTIDDAYITFRYARNILAGNGFVYNPGEHVLGTTTPFYTILLVIIGSLMGGVNAPFPQIALCVNALADGLSCLLLVFIGRKSNFQFAGIGAAFVWAVAPFSVTFAIGGLETSVYVFLLTAICLAHFSRRRISTALLAALALLTRPDALILIGPLALDRLAQVFLPRREKTSGAQARSSEIKSLLLEFLTFTLPILIWIGFSTRYFGSPLPHSIAAKTLAYRLPGEAAFVRLLQHYATPFLENLTFGVPAIAVGLVLYPFLFLIGARRLLSKDLALWPWLAYPWLYFLIFSAANPLIFRWYLTPPLPAYFFTILAGAESLLGVPQGRPGMAAEKGATRLKAIVTLIVIVAAPTGLSLRDWRLHPAHGLQTPAPEMAWYQLELYYRQAANTVISDAQGKSGDLVLAAGDVGVLGYFTGARILDTVGLNSPISTRYYPLDEQYYVINYAVPPDLIVDMQPDYVVILEVYGRAGLLKDKRFSEAYHLLEKIPTDIYGSDGMLIFKHDG